MKALAKFIAWQLTKDNFNSTRWVRHAGYLTDLDKHLYHQIVKHVDEERRGAPQRERCEAFILYWANNHAPFDYDKVKWISIIYIQCICNCHFSYGKFTYDHLIWLSLHFRVLCFVLEKYPIRKSYSINTDGWFWNICKS